MPRQSASFSTLRLWLQGCFRRPPWLRCGGTVPFAHLVTCGRCSMAFVLIVAGTALALFAAALLIIERENAVT